MQCGRSSGIDRKGGCESDQKWDPNVSTSTPELCVGKRVRKTREKSATEQRERDQSRRTPREGYSARDGHSASESNLSARQNDSAAEDTIPIEPKSVAGGDKKAMEEAMQRSTSPRDQDNLPPCRTNLAPRKASRQEKLSKCNVKKSRSCAPDVLSMSPVDADPSLVRQIRDIHNDMRSSVRIIKDSRVRLIELQKKPRLNEQDVKELSDRHELLLREMERFDRLTRSVQRVVDNEVVTLRKRDSPKGSPKYANPCYEPVIYHEMKMPHPTVTLGHAHHAPTYPDTLATSTARSKSEIDLTRKLNESYDMQEKLVADNADLEVKRYILYKELMTKDQNLETCRAQIKRLQGELKLMSKENALLHEKIARNCPEGDASSVSYKTETQKIQKTQDTKTDELASKLESYQNNTANFENQLLDLENEVRDVRENMEGLKKFAEDTSRAGAGSPACRKNTCITPENKPPPKKGQPCGICPPCPAPCNPSEPPKPVDREVAKLSIQLKTLEDSYKTKLTENSILRAELARKKEDLEKERYQHKDVAARLKSAEQQLETMIAHNNMMLGTKDQASEVEYNVKMLKQCYREAREEIDELRLLLKEQNEQLQNYKNKYMQTLQTVEEQKRQMDNMDMDNNRISEQINLEIQRIKNNFQDKLVHLTPLPDLLEKTQAKLKETQQSQAIAEHKVEKLSVELTKAREKIHELVHNLTTSVESTAKRHDEELLELLQQRITQLTQTNQSLKDEIERLKGHVIRMEEDVLVKETRLAEKMTECAKLGGMLDKTRDEAARSVVKANDRVENMKQTLQAVKADLERQLIEGRAKLRIAEKNYEEMQCRMKCQIEKLRENYEQAQLRILGMSTTIAQLRQAQPDRGDAGSESENGQCLCGVAFG